MTLKISFASNTTIIDHPGWYEEYNGHMPPVRNYQDIFITGEPNNDKALLHTAHLKIAQLVASNDTINGLHFNFGNNAAYGTFVQVVDILKTEGAKTFMPIDNELWVYNFPPQMKGQEFHYFLCGSVDYEVNIPAWLNFKKRASIFWANGREIIISFALFLITVAVCRYKKQKLYSPL